jgi:lipoprotein-anchoring transpeptidase ErfK/SrfK
MNVLESRGGRPLRLRLWVLLAGAVVVLAAVLFFTNGSAVPGHSGSTNTSSGSHSRSSGSSGSGSSRSGATGLSLRTTTPVEGAQGVAPNTTISVTFSSPVSAGTVTPVLTPAVAGTWVRTTATTLSYQLASPLIPSSRELLTIPGGSHGVRGSNGATLPTSQTVSFAVAAGDELRLQQLLAQLNFLPVAFVPSGPTPSAADLAQDQAGSFAWRWPNQPAELTSQWTQGTDNMITKAGIEAFETQNAIGVDGIAGPAVWTALINDTINHKVATTPYVFVLVNKVVPQGLTLWNNGVAQYTGIPVNTGSPGADTVDGTFAVFEHVRYSEMKGTNPDGSTYDDPNVPYASYFNGGDALHGFVRSSYGTPQSNGCVEMTYADAALVWPLTPIGTLVTVVGPNLGVNPTATTTTTAPPPPPTTTAAPPASPAPPAPTSSVPPAPATPTTAG